MELDSTDRRTVMQLDKDARASSSKIARKLRMSKGVVNYRIKNLEKRGVISGYYAIIDTFRLGYFSYRVYLKLQYSSPAVQKEITDHLLASPNVWWAGIIQGNFNISFLIWAKRQSEIISFWEGFNRKFRDRIAEARISVYHGLEQLSLPFGGGPALREPHTIGAAEQARIDETDARLLKLIAADARAPLLRLSDALGITPAAVRYRLKQLVRKKVIVAFRTNVAMEKLGFSLYKADFNVRDVSALKRMNEYARQCRNVYYIDRSIGWADFEIEAYFSSAGGFYSFLEKFRAEFADEIRDFSFFTYSKITKILYVPDDVGEGQPR